MFYRSYSLLTSLVRPGGLPLPRAQGEAVSDASAAARAAMDAPIEFMPLSRRLTDPDGYRALQKARRGSLEALCRVEPDDRRLRRAVDWMAAICEESRWSDNPRGEPFEDDAHPVIDFQCAETAVLLGWAARAFGERLTTRVAGKLVYEVRRRVFSPFLAHEDYPFMRGRGERPLTILTDIVLSALLLEHSDQRRAAILKQGLRLLDQAVNARQDKVETLSDAAAETGAVADLAALLWRATRGEVDLRPTYPTQGWLDQLLFAWLENGWFCDPAGADMKPAVSGAELFRIGQAADDDALMALGARLHRQSPLPSATVTGRLMDLICANELSAETRKPPRIRSAAAPRGRVMVSRFSGMTCALHTGGNRANAGGLMLFCDGSPVLVEVPGAANLPRIAGMGQLDRPDLACEAEFKPSADRDILSVDQTHAWPAGRVQMAQRTVIVDRNDALLRLVDAMELTEASVITYRFHTPEKPEPLTGGLRLGNVDLTWEGELIWSAAPLPDVSFEGQLLYRIELVTPAPVIRAMQTFVFARR